MSRKPRLIFVSLVLFLAVSRIAVGEPPKLDPEMFEGASDAPAPWLTTVEERLTAPALVRAHYTQERFVRGLTKPLVSKGTFLLYRPLGLAWVQESPFHIAHLVTPSGLIQKTYEGSHVDVLKAPQGSTVTQFTQLLLALFNGKLTDVSSSFTVVARGDAAEWRIAVQPKNPELSRFVKRALLEGTTSITRSTIEEGSGDLVVTTFDGTDTSGHEPTPEERAIFE